MIHHTAFAMEIKLNRVKERKRMNIVFENWPSIWWTTVPWGQWVQWNEWETTVRRSPLGPPSDEWRTGLEYSPESPLCTYNLSAKSHNSVSMKLNKEQNIRTSELHAKASCQQTLKKKKTYRLFKYFHVRRSTLNMKWLFQFFICTHIKETNLSG